jgi:hypothetical protein
VVVDAYGREHDRLGRIVPHRVSWMTLGRAIPGLLERFRPIPADYYEDLDDRALVHCPCGEEVSVRTGESEQCQCERIYLFAGRAHVANSPIASSVGGS